MNLAETREWISAEIWISAKLFIYQTSFISQLLEFIYRTVTILIFDGVEEESQFHMYCINCAIPRDEFYRKYAFFQIKPMLLDYYSGGFFPKIFVGVSCRTKHFIPRCDPCGWHSCPIDITFWRAFVYGLIDNDEKVVTSKKNISDSRLEYKTIPHLRTNMAKSIPYLWP